MHKIDTENRNSKDEFVDEDASQHIAGTDLNAAWFNTIQRELCKIVLGCGLSLKANDDEQVFKALQKIGIRAYAATNGSFTVSDDWYGSTLLLVSAKDLTINKSFDYGAAVIIVPAWYDNSPASIKVYYNNDYVEIKKGCGVFGIAMNGADALQLAAHPFAAPSFSGNLYSKNLSVEAISAASYVDKGYVNDSNSTGPNDEYKPWQLAKNWSVGQVKRVLSIASASDNYVINVFTSLEGNLSSVTMPKGGYREFMCIGHYDQGEDGFKYAVLAVNGSLKI